MTIWLKNPLEKPSLPLVNESHLATDYAVISLDELSVIMKLKLRYNTLNKRQGELSSLLS